MLTAVRLWILLSALLVGAGWILSACHELNRTGYGVVFAVAALVAAYWQQKAQCHHWKNPRPRFRNFFNRFKRPAPFLFLLLVLMSFISGVLYAPYNSDTYAYRIPRVLHWLGQEQWHWIHTADMRMNIAGCGYEWLAAPLILFTHTDRFLFLINWISYLMLPGLIFCLLRHLGVNLRVAWWWAWLLASGWCYVMQAASVLNDGFAAVYALAAVALALKSLESGEKTDFWLSFLAVALLTGVKQIDIPLAMLWAVVALPQWRSMLAKPLTAFITVAFGLLVSTVPITVFNIRHTGTWSGLSAILAENPNWHIYLNSPFWGILGNAFCIPIQNLVPPVFPWSTAWNHAMQTFVATQWGTHFKSFESFGGVSPGISESSAGIGLGITLLAMVSVFAARKLERDVPRAKRSNLQWALTLLPWVLLIIFMAKVGEQQNARHLSAYYVFFFPSLLAGVGHDRLVRKIWWQKMALVCMVLAASLLVVDNNRPLFPAKTIIEHLLAKHPQSNTLSLLQIAYTAPTSLEILKRQINEKLPPDELLVGYAAVGNAESEPALWLPFGSRRVVRVLKQDTPEQLFEAGVRYIVIQDRPSLDCSNIEEWMARYHAKLVADLPFKEERSRSGHLSHVYITRLEIIQRN